MATIRQGDAYDLSVRILSEGVALTEDGVDTIEFFFGRIRKLYVYDDVSSEVIFDTDHFLVPFTQEETFSLQDKIIDYQVRVKFLTGEVVGSPVKKCNIYDCISDEVL